MLAAEPRVLKSEHPDTLLTAGNLAGSLSDPGKDVNADQTQRKEVQQRVFTAKQSTALRYTDAREHAHASRNTASTLQAGTRFWQQVGPAGCVEPEATCKTITVFFCAPNFCRTHCRSKQSAAGFAVDNGSSNARNNKQLSLFFHSLSLSLLPLCPPLARVLALSLARAP